MFCTVHLKTIYVPSPPVKCMSKSILTVYHSGTDDFQVTPSTVTVTPMTPAIVEVNFIMDGIALEPNETVSLRFLPTVSVPIQEVLLDTIELTISDVDSKSSVHTLKRPVFLTSSL